MSVLEDLKKEHAVKVAAVEEARLVFEQRQAELVQFQTEAAEVLGLSNLHQKRIWALRTRYKQVQGLHEKGLTAPQIAEKLQLDVRVVEIDLLKYRRRAKAGTESAVAEEGSDDVDEEAADTEGSAKTAEGAAEAVGDDVSGLRAAVRAGVYRPGESVRDAVLRLTKEGFAPDQVAETLTVSRGTVGAHIGFLRREGLLAEASRPSPAPLLSVDGDASEPATACEPGDPPDVLRADAVQQCRRNNTPAGPCLFTTTLGGRRKHAHRAKLDRMGEGHTEPDETGHVHRVSKFVVQDYQRHGHGLKRNYNE